MLEIIDINDDYFAEQLQEATKRHALSDEFAAIYAHMADHYLDQAWSAERKAILRAINFNDPRYDALRVKPEECDDGEIRAGRRHYDFDISDIATQSRGEWHIKGKHNQAIFRTRESIAKKVEKEIYASGPAWRIRQLLTHGYPEPTSYAPLEQFSLQFSGNVFDACENLRRFEREVLQSLQSEGSMSRELKELARDAERVSNEQEKLIIRLAHKLLHKRHEAIGALLTEEYPPEAAEWLGKAYTASAQAVSLIDIALQGVTSPSRAMAD